MQSFKYLRTYLAGRKVHLILFRATHAEALCGLWAGMVTEIRPRGQICKTCRWAAEARGRKVW